MTENPETTAPAQPQRLSQQLLAHMRETYGAGDYSTQIAELTDLIVEAYTDARTCGCRAHYEVAKLAIMTAANDPTMAQGVIQSLTAIAMRADASFAKATELTEKLDPSLMDQVRTAAADLGAPADAQ